MKKPDFSQMSYQELRNHILANRKDDDAIEAIISRADPNSPMYPFPKTEEDFQEMEEILRRRLGQNRDSA